MKKTVRHQAVDILNRVGAGEEFASLLINDHLDQGDLSGTADGRLLTHLVYGVLRMRGHLDWILSKLYRGRFAHMDEGIKNVLRLSLFQLKFSDRLPDFAVVDEAVKIARIIHPENVALVNAMLRNYLRRGRSISFPSQRENAADYIAAFHSHPLWLVKKWMKLLGVRGARALCAANNELPPLTLRVNTLKISRDDLIQELQAAGFEPAKTRFSPDGIVLKNSAGPVQKTNFFKNGFLRIQDEGAQLIAYLTDHGECPSILDACAGTGGKATHLAAVLHNKGRIVAVDQSLEKLDDLQKDAERLGIDTIETQVMDLSQSLPESFHEKFDCVLADAPCSGTGTLRRNPEIKWRITAEDLTDFTGLQQRILQNASAAVKKGGFLIYCTCSLLAEENENIVDHFLKMHTDFSLDKPSDSINRQLLDRRGFFQTHPHRHPMDGFFGAVMRRQ